VFALGTRGSAVLQIRTKADEHKALMPYLWCAPRALRQRLLYSVAVLASAGSAKPPYLLGFVSGAEGGADRTLLENTRTTQICPIHP
jgi:hypothetical protein